MTELENQLHKRNPNADSSNSLIFLKDPRVLNEILRLKLTKSEVLKWNYEIFKFWSYIYTPNAKELPLSVKLVKNEYGVQCQWTDANNSAGKIARIERNIMFPELSVATNSEAYSKITIEDIKNNILPWQHQNWPKLKKFIDNVLENKPTSNLYIYGSLGTGKTTLSYAIMNFLALNNVKVCMFHSLKLFNLVLRNQKYKNIVSDLEEIDVLIIDDLGRDPSSPTQTWFINDFLFSILYTRYLTKKPMIFTSNFSPQEYVKLLNNILKTSGLTHIGERIYDVISNNSILISSQYSKNIRKG